MWPFLNVHYKSFQHSPTHQSNTPDHHSDSPDWLTHHWDQSMRIDHHSLTHFRLPSELPSADSPQTRTAWKTLLHQKRPFSGPLDKALFRTSVPAPASPVSPPQYGLSPASTARNHRAAVRKTPATHTALVGASKLLSLQWHFNSE
jgi:hypothetical protein